MKFNSFLITIATKTDVSEETISKFLAYVRKKCLYSYVVSELTQNGVRHVHASVVMKHKIDGENLQKNIWEEYVQPYHQDCIRKYAVVISVMYKHEWYDTYLSKQECAVVLLDRYDRAEVEKWFPTEEEQIELQAMCKRLPGPAADTRSQLVKLVEAWESYDPVARNAHDAARYLYYRMYVERSMLDIRDHRRVAQLAWSMFCMRFKIEQPSHEVRELVNKWSNGRHYETADY